MSTESVFERFEQYPFDTDPVFQNGLASIITPLGGKPVEVVDETIGKAKAFYFSRSSGEQLSWDDYVQYRKQRTDTAGEQRVEDPSSAQGSAALNASLSTPPPNESATEFPAGLYGAAPPLSFSNIADLIMSGQTHLIPNNDIIPNKLSEEKPSESRASIRKKPWETASPIATESSPDSLAS